MRARLVLEYQDQVGATSGNNKTALGPLVVLPDNKWTAVRFPNAQVDPAWKVAKVSVRVTKAATSVDNFSGDVYVDTFFVKGVAESVTDSKPTPVTISRYSYDWDQEARASGTACAGTLATGEAQPVGACTSVERPDDGGVWRRFGYLIKRDGQVTRTVNPYGKAGGARYDNFLRLNQLTMPGGDSSSYGYWANGSARTNHTSGGTTEAGETWSRGADLSNGETTWSLDPKNDKLRADGLADYMGVVPVRDAAGNVTEVQENWYGAGTNKAGAQAGTLGTPKSTARRTRYAYGAGGVLASMTDPKGNVTSYEYQATNTGYLTKITAPAGTGETVARVTTFVPNKDGTVAETKDPKGQVTKLTYDGLGRLTKIQYGWRADGTADGAAELVHAYALDANGNMLSVTETKGTAQVGKTTWAYDENDRPTSESRTQGGVTKTATYAYYPNGMQRSIATFDGRTTALSYDDAFRLISQTDPRSPNAGSYAFGYDDRGRRTSVALPSGARRTVSYLKGRLDVMRLLDPAGTTVLQSFDYAYNTGGNVSSVVEVTSGLSSTTSYTYDAHERLATAERTGSSPYARQTYGYDASDNRTSVQVGTGTAKAATYDGANQLTGYDGNVYKYDQNGNLTAYGPSATPGANTLPYDAADPGVSGTVGGKAVEFGYDGHGRRSYKTISGARTDHWYDQTGMALETGADPGECLRSPGGES